MAHENTAEGELTQNRGEGALAPDATPRPRELSEPAREPLSVDAANDLVERVAAAMVQRSPLPPGLVMAWTHRGAEAWTACDCDWIAALARSLGALRYPAQAVLDRHRNRFHRDDGTTGERSRCCADVVRSLVPCPTAEQLAGWGRGGERR